MAKDLARSVGRAQAAMSRRPWQHDLMRIKPWIGFSRRLLQLALLAMLLLATGQGALVKVGAYDTPGFAQGVALSGSYAYVADGGSGLQIIDVSNPVSPFLKGAYDTPDFARSVALSGSRAYVADGSSGLQIIDVSNPASPTWIGAYDTPGYAMGVALDGSYAYVADGSSGLLIIDVSNPASPFRKGSYYTSDFAYGVALSGSYAYVAYGYSGLQIIDVSNPASPFLKGSYDTPGTAYGVALSGSYAYVADDNSGLQIIDVSNPASPLLKGSYDTPDYAIGVALSGSHAYVADGYSGLQILAEGATLQGRAWKDLNEDGLQDAGESGLAGVPVELQDASGNSLTPPAAASTDGNGNYRFSTLPGSFRVKFTLPSGKVFSPKDQGADDSLDSDVNQTTGQTDVITVAAGQNSLHWDAGLFQPHLSISGNKTTDKGAAVSG